MNSYTKLKDGSWGVRATQSNMVAGDTLYVTKKDGSQKTETVAKVLWTGTDDKTGQVMSLCAIRQAGQAGNGHSHSSSARRFQDSNCSCWQCRRGNECMCVRGN